MAKKIEKAEVPTASSEEASAFVTALQEKFQRKKRTPEERERLRKYLAEYSRGYLRSIARRVLIDIMKGPGQTPAYGAKSKPSRRPTGKRAARSRRKSAKP
jgi:acyl-CoA reductase-like NAD-dependent aldehyde dehydrogenase